MTEETFVGGFCECLEGNGAATWNSSSELSNRPIINNRVIQGELGDLSCIVKNHCFLP